MYEIPSNGTAKKSEAAEASDENTEDSEYEDDFDGDEDTDMDDSDNVGENCHKEDAYDEGSYDEDEKAGADISPEDLAEDETNIEGLNGINGLGEIDEPIYARLSGEGKGESIDDIAAGIVNAYETHKAPQNISVEFFTDFDQVKDRLAMKVINAEKNAEMLENCPHFQFGDLAAILQVQVESNEFGNATITVKNEHMEMWGADAEVLMSHARENMEEKQPIRIQSMIEVLQSMMDGEFPDDMMGNESKY